MVTLLAEPADRSLVLGSIGDGVVARGEPLNRATSSGVGDEGGDGGSDNGIDGGGAVGR